MKFGYNLQRSIYAVGSVGDHEADLVLWAKRIAQTIKDGGKVMWAGNGGSAATAQHLSAELVGRFEKMSLPYASIALSTDTSVLTAIANDCGYRHVFSRQIDALARPGDVVVLITTSGISENIAEAADAASRRCSVVVLTSTRGADFFREKPVLAFKGDSTAAIQEAHLVAGHLLVGMIEQELHVGAEIMKAIEKDTHIGNV